MRIAVEGCGHGTLHAIYASIKKSCEVIGRNGVDLLIIGGDFQAVRNSCDLNCMSVPQKYRAIGDFHEYYSGSRRAPYLTLFVGGNHEASSHLQELYYGGWVAPNIYYMGAANVVRFGDLRIVGLSGIWKGYNYNKPHFERIPYLEGEIKSLYHVREIDVRKILLVRNQVDVGISHDWPRGVEWQGDHKALFRQKSLFEEESKAGTLGSPAAKYVMDRLRPPHWFSAHMHCKFAAVVDHGKETQPSTHAPAASRVNRYTTNVQTTDKQGRTVASKEDLHPQAPQLRNDDEIDLDLDEDSAADPPEPSQSIDIAAESNTTNDSVVPSDLRSQLPAAFARPTTPPPENKAPSPPPPKITNTRTNFLALDKCLPNRKFLQILDITPSNPSASPTTSPPKLTYDPEWLAILRVFASHDPHKKSPQNLGESQYNPSITAQEAWVEENLVKSGKLQVPENFEITAPVYDGGDIRSVGGQQPEEYTNPQTSAFCKMLGIENFFDASEEERVQLRQAKGAEIEAEARAFGRRGGGGGGRTGGTRGDGGRGTGRGRGGGGEGRGRSRGGGRGFR